MKRYPNPESSRQATTKLRQYIAKHREEIDQEQRLRGMEVLLRQGANPGLSVGNHASPLLDLLLSKGVQPPLRAIALMERYGAPVSSDLVADLLEADRPDRAAWVIGKLGSLKDSYWNWWELAAGASDPKPLVEALMGRGVSINAKTAVTGYTFLHYLAIRQPTPSRELVEWIVGQGADPSIADSLMRLPIDRAPPATQEVFSQAFQAHELGKTTAQASAPAKRRAL